MMMMQQINQTDLFAGTVHAPDAEVVANDNYTKWQRFHRENPHVYELIKKFTQQAIDAGFKHYGIQSVAERVRWHTMIETNGEPLKLNNNHTAYYARLYMEEHPEHSGFFRTRAFTSRSAAND